MFLNFFYEFQLGFHWSLFQRAQWTKSSIGTDGEVINIWRSRQNGRHFKATFLYENCLIWIKMSLKFVPKAPNRWHANHLKHWWPSSLMHTQPWLLNPVNTEYAWGSYRKKYVYSIFVSRIKDTCSVSVWNRWFVEGRYWNRLIAQYCYFLSWHFIDKGLNQFVIAVVRERSVNISNGYTDFSLSP